MVPLLASTPMKRHIQALGTIAFGVLSSSLAWCQITQRITAPTDASQAGSSSGFTYLNGISGDGRWVVFESSSTWGLESPYDSWPGIFVRDRRTGATEIASVASDGTDGDSISYQPVISRNGRFVAFVSFSTNLVPGDTNNAVDVFVHDRWTGATEIASVASDGTLGNSSSGINNLGFSDDGRYVVFWSFASNLVPSDTNGREDVFVRDRQLGITERVSLTSSGGEIPSWSRGCSISGDGRFVAFASDADGIVPGDDDHAADIFVRDRLVGTTERVSISTTGQPGNARANDYRTAISADGRFVAFSTPASNFAPGDRNDTDDVFVRDRQLSITELVSVALTGGTGSGGSNNPAISADGRFVAFETDADDLVPIWDGDVQVCVRDRSTGTTVLASVSHDGAPASGGAWFPSISADGRSILFGSETSHLVPDDVDVLGDVFVRDLAGGPIFTSTCEPGSGGTIGCPCANPPSGSGRGCDNSGSTGGAVLSATGATFVSSDSLRFTTQGEVDGQLSVLVQGTSITASGIVYGQGVRCATGSLQRLFTKISTAGGITAPDFGAGDPTVSARSSSLGSPIRAVEGRSYVVFYRDPVVLGGCPASSTFNATQAGVVTWSP